MDVLRTTGRIPQLHPPELPRSLALGNHPQARTDEPERCEPVTDKVDVINHPRVSFHCGHIPSHIIIVQEPPSSDDTD